MDKTLLDVDQVPIDLLTGVVLLLSFAFVLVLFDVVLVDLDESCIPIFGIKCVDDHEDLGAQLIMQPFLVFQGYLQIAVLSLRELSNNL